MEDSSLISHAVYGPEIAGVLIPRHRIAARLDELARRIIEAYPDGELTILAALTGSLVFLSDLIRRLPLRLRLDVVRVSSYPHQATASRGPSVLIASSGDLYRNLPDVCLLRDLAGRAGR
jgi:hypoxanthine phosphoribosyltransferase